MSNYGWIVTSDHVTEPGDNLPSRAGVLGPSDIPAELEASLKAGNGYRWKAYDDDGNLYYEGRLVLDPGIDPGQVTIEQRDGWPAPYVTSLPEEAFGPLNDFATPDAGAVTIKYADSTGRLAEL